MIGRFAFGRYDMKARILAIFEGKPAAWWRTLSQITTELQAEKRLVSKELDELVKGGIMTREQKYVGAPTYYRLWHPSVVQQQEAHYEYLGRMYSLSGLVKHRDNIHKLARSVIHHRIAKLGWTVGQALLSPRKSPRPRDKSIGQPLDTIGQPLDSSARVA
jgi:hypothetical protein